LIRRKQSFSRFVEFCSVSFQLSVPPVNTVAMSWVSVVSCWMFSDYMFNLHGAKINTSAERALVEDALADDDAHLEDAPPLDAGVGALGGVAVGALADDDVALFVLDLGEEFGELLDCWWVLSASDYCRLYVQCFVDGR
jgi:hypothetical protein